MLGSEKLLLDKTLSAELNGKLEPPIGSILVLPTELNSSIETVQVSELALG